MISLAFKVMLRWADTISNAHKQQLLLDSLLVFSEYAIKTCSAKTIIKGETFVEMNVLPSYDLSCFDQLAQSNNIIISFSPIENKVCIYRIVTINKKDIKKLYFCRDKDAST
jgi:hypothetical protein